MCNASSAQWRSNIEEYEYFIAFCCILYWFFSLQADIKPLALSTTRNPPSIQFVCIFYEFVPSFKNWIGATPVRLINGICIYPICTGHFHRPKLTKGDRQSFAENSFASKNSICARQHSLVHFSMWPWIKAASFTAFLCLTVNAKRGSGVALILPFLWLPMCSFLFNVNAHNVYIQWKCDCMCRDDAVSWKNSNRCQTNSPHSFTFGCSLWWWPVAKKCSLGNTNDETNVLIFCIEFCEWWSCFQLWTLIESIDDIYRNKREVEKSIWRHWMVKIEWLRKHF